MARLRAIGKGQWIYLLHVLGLLAPGMKLPTHDVDQLTPGDVSGWDTADLTALIEEGRRQSDRQQAELDSIRGRAQWLFTVAAAALAALGAGFTTTDTSAAVNVTWLVGMALLVYGLGGAASIVASRADFRVIHAAVLSTLEKPVTTELAKAYSGMMSTGENTVAARLTIFRQSVVFCLCGGYLALVAALLSA